MPRFYFHVHDGQSVRDAEGTELNDCKHARREAIKLAGQILDNEAAKVELAESWRMDVADETGVTVFRLAFSLRATAPAE